MKDLIKHIDDTNFSTTIANGTVLVDFSAEWCGPCKMLNPILDNLAKELEGKVVVAKVDVDQAPKTTQNFQITSVPTLIVFTNGQEKNRVVGVKDVETLKKIVLQ